MRQTVSVDVVSGSVDSYAVGVEARDRCPQEFADSGVVSKNFIEHIQSLERILFEIADDGDLLAFACDDER